MTTLPKSLSSQLAFGITKSTNSQTPGGVLIVMVSALLSGTQGEKLRRWGLFHFIGSRETIPEETAYIQRREETDELCVLLLPSPAALLLSPGCPCPRPHHGCFPLPFCAWGTREVLVSGHASPRLAEGNRWSPRCENLV